MRNSWGRFLVLYFFAEQKRILRLRYLRKFCVKRLFRRAFSFCSFRWYIAFWYCGGITIILWETFNFKGRYLVLVFFAKNYNFPMWCFRIFVRKKLKNLGVKSRSDLFRWSSKCHSTISKWNECGLYEFIIKVL